MSYEKDLAIIEAATPGPWEDDVDPSLVVTHDKQGTIGDMYCVEDKRFVKHFNPVKVRELVEENQRLREWRSIVMKYIDRMNDPCQMTDPAEKILQEFTKEAEELLK